MSRRPSRSTLLFRMSFSELLAKLKQDDTAKKKSASTGKE